MTGFLSRRARTSGVELHWVEVGEGPPLVLLHGLADSHRTWHRVLPLLARRYRVYAIDLPGHGLSERPEASYDLAWHARLVGQLVDYLELDGFDILGHSYGGGVAQFLLLTHAERVRRVGLVAAGGLGREVHVALRLMALPITARAIQPLMGLGTRVGVQAIGRGAFDEAERNWLGRINEQPGSARAFAKTTRGVIGLFGQTVHFLDHAARIPQLPAMRMFWGERDGVVPLAHGRKARDYLRHVDLVRFARSGHFPHLSEPTRFVDAVDAFLAAPVLPRAELVQRRRLWPFGHRAAEAPVENVTAMPEPVDVDDDAPERLRA